MDKNLVAKSSITINVPVSKVWDALVNPQIIKQYMFGTEAVSDWKEGSSIVFQGVWEGKKYEDKGKILKIESEKTLQYSHFSPLSGAADVPENYHIVTFELAADGDGTQLFLTQDNNATDQEREHSEKMWETMLGSLKKLLEE